MDAKALNDALSGNYMLVELQIHSWGANKTDEEASRELKAMKGATNDAGKFMKNLLAAADTEYKAVKSAATATRNYLYDNTVPWASKSEGSRRGPRLMPTLKAMEILAGINERKAVHDAAVLKLKEVFPTRVAEALQNLSGMADPTQYPSQDAIPELFSITVDLRPVPSMVDYRRLNVPAELISALEARNANQAEVKFDAAMENVRDRLLKALERMNTQLAKRAAGEDTRLFETLTSNLKSVVDLARDMNVTGNAKLTDLADRIEAKLLLHPIEVYKNNIVRAGEAAAEAKNLAVEAAMEEVWN